MNCRVCRLDFSEYHDGLCNGCFAVEYDRLKNQIDELREELRKVDGHGEYARVTRDKAISELQESNRLNDDLKYFIENYGGVAHLILTTTFDDDAHKWVKTLEDIVDKSVDPELLYWCAWCGVHRVEVEDWADRPECSAVVAAKKLKEQWTEKRDMSVPVRKGCICGPEGKCDYHRVAVVVEPVPGRSDECTCDGGFDPNPGCPLHG